MLDAFEDQGDLRIVAEDFGAVGEIRILSSPAGLVVDAWERSGSPLNIQP